MKKIIGLIIFLLILAGASYIYYDYKKDQEKKTADQNQSNQQSQNQKNDNQPKQQENNQEYKNYPDLGVGDENDYIVKLHQKLSDAGVFPGNLVDVNHYGEKTQHSVMLFQLTQDMDATGIVNQNTWKALYNPKPIDKNQLPELEKKIPIDPGHVSEDHALDKMVKSDTKVEVNENTDTSKTHPDEQKTDNGKKVAYFTFDDGPNRNYSPEILKILDKYDARATFFVIGEEAEKMPDLLQEENRHGCVIGNHTYSHIDLKKASAAKFKNQIEKTNDIIKKAVKQTPKCLRPPYGSVTKQEKLDILKDFGMETVLWDVDPQDWSRPGTQTIINHVLKYIQPGEIVLMHDGGGDRSESVAALRTIMKTLDEKGWVFKSICEYQ